MLTLQLNSPEIEAELKQHYGDNSQAIAQAFKDFLWEKRIKNDLKQAEIEIIEGKVVTAESAFQQVKSLYKA